jgi:hypothetical protein
MVCHLDHEKRRVNVQTFFQRRTNEQSTFHRYTVPQHQPKHTLLHRDRAEQKARAQLGFELI